MHFTEPLAIYMLCAARTRWSHVFTCRYVTESSRLRDNGVSDLDLNLIEDIIDLLNDAKCVLQRRSEAFPQENWIS
jgi:hypothetical protein